MYSAGSPARMPSDKLQRERRFAGPGRAFKQVHLADRKPAVQDFVQTLNARLNTGW